MKRVFFYIIALSCITMLFASCKNENIEAENKQATTAECGESDHLINATLWMQHSAEYRACCLQTYKLAKVALAENLKAKQTDKPAAVVLDIDETVLDNSYYEAYMAAEATSFCDSTWAIWTSKADATEVPGAIDFLKYAQSLGVEIIFISNRYPEELEPTMANMKKLGFPEVPAENFLMKQKDASSCKKERREKVSEKYEIIMLVGDNMGDHSEIFDERKTKGDMLEETDAIIDLLGTRYIVLPNPTYGTWEKPILADKEKTARQNRINALKTF
ncbi:MAG: 5'-nucleotidase, lipoprotein e(P4) family [Bacteroidales bacterium]|nr:5'-nucleotidase, lipoprotein e(P4) family [Bacteroidales bacterium]MBQ1731719.1 5'-nucleotidase, lipoprotein e(P4) family [Bacteroidales bacterium]